MSLEELKSGLGVDRQSIAVPDHPITPAFDNLGLDDRLVRELHRQGLVTPTEVQAESIPLGITGENVLCQSHTGTGKTLAFGLALLQQLSKAPAVQGLGRKAPARPAALVLVPTRELALQVQRELAPYAAALGRRVCCIYGGSPYRPQEQQLRQGVDLVIATPGRLLDHMEKSNLSMQAAQFLVLDEADQMLEIGFEKELNLIVGKMPTETKRQTFLFSATMPRWVQQSSNRLFQTAPVQLNLVQTGKTQTSADVHHLAVVCPSEAYRNRALAPLIQTYGKGRGLVFTDTKADADTIGRALGRTFPTAVLHGDVPQASREKALNAFRQGEIDCLVATDVAARGIDVPLIPLVVQYRPPRSTETYIHRAGRTGRAGNTGVSALLYSTNRQEARVPATLQKGAGFEFEYVGDLKNSLLGSATLESVTGLLGEQLTKVKAQDRVQQHLTDIVGQLCAKHNQRPEAVLAAVVARLGGFENVLELPSLLTRAQDMTTLQLQGDRKKPTAVMHQVLQRAGVSPDQLGKKFSRPDGTLYFDVHRDAAELVLSVSSHFPQLELRQAVKPPSFQQNDRNGRKPGRRKAPYHNRSPGGDERGRFGPSRRTGGKRY